MSLSIDMKDKTAYRGGRCFFFRSQFEDETILAFFSDNPCGCCYDQDKGWVIIDLKQKTIIDECNTKYLGISTGEYRDWIKNIRKQHGKTRKVFRNPSGTLLWKMEE